MISDIFRQTDFKSKQHSSSSVPHIRRLKRQLIHITIYDSPTLENSGKQIVQKQSHKIIKTK